MKCLLYVPQYECEGIRETHIADVRVGGLTLLERACLSIQAAGFSDILLVKSHTYEMRPLARLNTPVQALDYDSCPDEIAEQIVESLGDKRICLCVLDAMLSPSCFSIPPDGADVRILIDGTPTGIYFVSHQTAQKIVQSEHGLDDIESHVAETWQAPDHVLYHRMMCADDLRTGQNKLTRSLRKPLGRESDGLVAYFINRPCSLQISKRLANTKITPNMVTFFGLLLGLAAATLVATGDHMLMVAAVILWQLSSMVDGIDGELARMRMSPSHKGEWFDTICDDVTNITFMLGLGHGLYMIGNDFPFMGENSALYFFYIAAGVCTLMVIAVGWFYLEFLKMGIASHNHFEWGFESENKINKTQEHRNILRRTADLIAGGFAWIAKRDFYTFLIMLLVICDLNQPAYFIMLTGASFVGIGGLIALSIRAIRHRGKPKSPEAAPSPETNPK